MIVLYNGQLIGQEQVTISLEDRGYQFGDGVYEVIRVYNGKFFTLEEHLERLWRSSMEIGLETDLIQKTLKDNIEKLVYLNDLKDGIVYIQITRGVAPRVHEFPGKGTLPQVTAYTKSLNRPIGLQEKGVYGTLVEDIRWSRCDIKSLNLLGNVLAKQQAKEKGCYEAIQFRNGYITEGSSSNVFIVVDGVVYTHPNSNLILSGITRLLVLQFCQTLNIPIIEEKFTVEQLMNADEVFITSTTSEILPIIEVEKQIIGNGIPGSITKNLLSEYNSLIHAISVS